MNVFDRIVFFLSYVYGKVSLLWLVRRPRLGFFLYELKYSLTNGLRHIFPRLKPCVYHGESLIETTRGKYCVRRGSHDAALISPAFERRDRRHLENLVASALKQNPKNTLFLDIGANIGAFSVTMALKFPSLQIMAFEPAPENLVLLHKNLKLNHIEGRVKVFAEALSDHCGEAPFDFDPIHPGDSKIVTLAGSVTVKTSRLMDHSPQFAESSTVVMKMDVEGHELNVLRGLGTSLDRSHVILMTEDMFRSEELHQCLRGLGFQFQSKLSTYNSFWTRGLTSSGIVPETPEVSP